MCWRMQGGSLRDNEGIVRGSQILRAYAHLSRLASRASPRLSPCACRGRRLGFGFVGRIGGLWVCECERQSEVLGWFFGCCFGC